MYKKIPSNSAATPPTTPPTTGPTELPFPGVAKAW